MAVGTKSGSRGPSESLQDLPKAHFGPKRALLGPQGAKKGSNTRPKCVVYNDCSPGRPISSRWDQIWPPGTLRVHRGPLKGAFRAKTGPFGVPWGPEDAQYQAKVSGNHDSNPFGPICGNWDQIWPQVWPSELFSQLGLVLGQKGPLGPPVRTYKAPEWANITYNYVSYPWVVF